MLRDRLSLEAWWEHTNKNMNVPPIVLISLRELASSQAQVPFTRLSTGVGEKGGQGVID